MVWMSGISGIQFGVSLPSPIRSSGWRLPVSIHQSSRPRPKTTLNAGLPWFDYYDAEHEAVSGSDILKSMKSVAQTGKEKGEAALPDNESISGGQVISLRDTRKREVREYPASESLDS